MKNNKENRVRIELSELLKKKQKLSEFLKSDKINKLGDLRCC